MNASNNDSILAWLPKPGESKPIPGGVIWCQSWRTNMPPGEPITGEIVFEFRVSMEEYRKAISEPVLIPARLAIEEANKEPTK